MVSILEEMNLVNRLIIIGPNINCIRTISRGPGKGRSKDKSHDFVSQSEVEVLILDVDSRIP